MNNCPVVQVANRLGHKDATVTLKVYASFIEQLGVDFNEYMPKIHAWEWKTNDIPQKSHKRIYKEILEISKLFRNPIAIGFSQSGGMAESGLL